MPGALLTDLYELTMTASYLRRGMTDEATFSLFVRDLPPQRGYLVACGLEECLSYLEDLSFTPDDLEYLTSQGTFRPEDIDAFSSLRFTGEVWAVPEGRIVFANEPLLEVTAPLPQAQLVETYLLNAVTFATAVASKAARCVDAAGGRDCVEFGMRRTQGLGASMRAARATAVAGFAATSNVEAARRFGLIPTGTMAHSYVEAFPTERDAFRAFASDFPDRSTFLVDTYDTIDGVRTAIEVIRELGLHGQLAVRLDSGDLDALARDARAALDAAGMSHVRIFASGGLDEFRIAELVDAAAPIDAFGIGTRVGTSADAPYLDSAYKLVSYDGRPVMKRSIGKATLPGAKQVFRGHDGDVLALREEPCPAGHEPLLEMALSGGSRMVPPAGVPEARDRLERDRSRLPREARRVARPEVPEVVVSERLRALADEVSRGRR